MPDPGGGLTIKAIRGHVEGWGDQILDFWSTHGALEGEEAHRRLADVVCVLLDDSGEIVGVNSVYEEAIPLIGGRSFYVYRVFLLPEGAPAGNEMFIAAYEALDAEFRADRSGPVGMCLALAGEQVAGQPEAIWPDTHLLYAGTQPDGSQLRIRYFYDATIEAGQPNAPNTDEWIAQDHSMPEGYRIEPLADTDLATVDDVVALWVGENAMPEEEARRRVDEVLMVAISPDGALAGVSTVYVQRNTQLGMDLWHYRTYVAADHRMSFLALWLLWATRDHLRERFEGGADTRAPGMLMEIENDFLKTYYTRGYWEVSHFVFIGESERGAHVRVHYFPGAMAPVPG
jgi:hypothetical protein